MNWKHWIIAAGVITFLVIVGGIGFVIVRPTTTQRADKIDNKSIYVGNPETPILGCSAWKVNTKIFWQGQYKPNEMKPKEVK